MKTLDFFEPVRIGLIIAFAIGIGIAFHEVFFLVAIVLGIVTLIHAIMQHIHRVKPVHRHL